MRVVMFGEQVFSRNWVDAARLVADVVHVRRVERSDAERRAEFREATELPGLFRVLDDPSSYEFEARTDLPYRLLGRSADLPNARALVTALRFVQREHGSIDLLHGHFYSGSRDFPYLRRRLGVPYVVTEHSTALTRQSPDKSITRMGRRIARNVYANAAFVMPVSETLLAAIEDLGLPGRFVVVPNPVDVSRFSQAQPHVEGTFGLVCVARLARVKAIDVLLRALVPVVASFPDVRLTVIGGGPEASSLRSLCVELGLDDVVEFTGSLPNDQLPPYLSRANAFVISSLVENLSIAVIEALTAGLPVVATRVGGQPELVGPADGILVPVGDEGALSQALLDIISGNTTFDMRAIAQRAQDRYSEEVVAKRLADIYSRALNV